MKYVFDKSLYLLQCVFTNDLVPIMFLLVSCYGTENKMCSPYIVNTSIKEWKPRSFDVIRDEVFSM